MVPHRLDQVIVNLRGDIVLKKRGLQGRGVLAHPGIKMSLLTLLLSVAAIVFLSLR